MRIIRQTLLLLLLFIPMVSSASLDTADNLPDFTIVPRHSDAGGQNHCKNIRKYQPESKEALINLVKAANQMDYKIIITGSNHSMAGQVTCHADAEEERYILLSLNQLPVKHYIDGNTITISAHATWQQVIAILQNYDEADLAPAVMQDYSVFSIAGTLSANAMGRDPNYGPFIDSLQSFTMLLGSGDIITCSREINRDCFTSVVGGYGAFGVILKVTLTLAPNVTIIPVRFKLSSDMYIKYVLRYIVEGNPAFNKHFGILHVDANDVNVTVHDYYTANTPPMVIEEADFPERTQEKLFPMTRRSYLDNNKFTYSWGEYGHSNQLLGVAIPIEDYKTFISGLPALLSSVPDVNIHEITTKVVPKQETDNMLQLITEDSIVFVFMASNTREDQQPLARFKQNLYALARKSDGRAYLAFDIPKDVVWLRASYPRYREWLALKKQYDPDYTFYNQFFHTFRSLTK